MKVLITGANGYLASRICSYYKDKHGIYGLTHAELDYTNVVELQKVFEKINPEIVIHCGAISNAEWCKENQDKAWYNNVFGTGTVADACSQIDAKLIFCSTDQVYSGGDVTIAHTEQEHNVPFSIYGKQKLDAERIAMTRNRDTVCIRLGWMYDLGHREQEHGDLMRSLFTQLKAGQEIAYPVHDYRNITWVWDIVNAMERIWELPTGIYNMASTNEVSTYQLMEQFMKPYEAAKQKIVKNEELFADSPRNIRMDMAKTERSGLQFLSTIDRLETLREQFESVCRQQGINL